jgi:hypothetical protein
MNKDKVGEPFHHPKIFHFLFRYAKIYIHFLYRWIKERFAEGHTHGKVFAILDYRIINRIISISISTSKYNISKKEFEDAMSYNDE